MTNLDAALAPVSAALADRRASLFVLSGAGTSAGSGLPTYRGAGGLYPTGALIPLQARDATSRRVADLWQRLHPLAAAAAQAAPSAAHAALAAYEADGGRVTVATQNVDGLHQRAGSGRVLELHGSLAMARCLNPRCQTRVPSRYPDPGTADAVPRCDCGARVRPDAVLFGEQLDSGLFRQAEAAARDADVVVALGTSLQVHPAAGLVTAALDAGAVGLWLELDPGAMLNRVDADDYASFSRLTAVPGDCAETLPALLG